LFKREGKHPNLILSTCLIPLLQGPAFVALNQKVKEVSRKPENFKGPAGSAAASPLKTLKKTLAHFL